MTAKGTPAADWSIDEALVRALVADQFPPWASLPLREVGSGWDNTLFQLGDQWAVRMPRRALAVPLIEREQRWLPTLAPGLPLPVPVPLGFGVPGRGYPYPWSVVPWLGGQTADSAILAPGERARLARFLRALHRPAPEGAPQNPYRGVALNLRHEVQVSRMADLAGQSGWEADRVVELWNRARSAPLDLSPTWIHGDLHPRNLLVEDQRWSGVIDWGDLGVGDPATDLSVAWMLADQPGEVQELLEGYGDLTEATRWRAAGWALVLGVLLWSSGRVDHPVHEAMGRRTVAAVLGSVGSVL